jgi:hypothetical protein
MIYSGSWVDDYNQILRHINSFTKAIGVQGVHVSPALLKNVCVKMYEKFPQSAGHHNSSAFKKVGMFVAYFMHYRPIKSPAPGYQIGGISDPDLNAVIALDIAIIALEESTIHKKEGGHVIVSEPIYLSDHSYADTIDALSLGCEEPKYSYHMLAIYFEQLVYKTNPHCQYGPSPELDRDSGTNPSEQNTRPGFYQTHCPIDGGDDLMGV